MVKGGMRPKLDKSWPSKFSNLLTRCWDRDPVKRPSFAEIVLELNQLIGPSTVIAAPKGRRLGTPESSAGSKNSHSTWF